MSKIICKHIKNRGGSKSKGNACLDERESMHSDDEPLAHHLERKRKFVWYQVNKNAKKVKDDFDVDIDEQESKSEGGDSGLGSSKGMFGNSGSIQKDIGILKHKIFLLNKEMEQFSKMARGERTLGQHIDKLSEVIGNAEEVKNLMHKIPMFEAKLRVMDKDIHSVQVKVSKLESKLGNMDKQLKQMVENVSTFHKKNVVGKDQDSPLGVDSQGPSMRTQAHLKKIEETSRKDEVKAAAETMHSLVDQVMNLINTPQLVSCYSFAKFFLFFPTLSSMTSFLCSQVYFMLGLGFFFLQFFSLACFQNFAIVQVSSPLKPSFT